MTPLLPTSASELLTSSTSVPVGASSVMVVWKAGVVKTGALSLTSLTKTVTMHVPLREGTPGNEQRVNSRGLVHFLLLTDSLFDHSRLMRQHVQRRTYTRRLIKYDSSFALRSARNLICAPVRMNMATPTALHTAHLSRFPSSRAAPHQHSLMQNTSKGLNVSETKSSRRSSWGLGRAQI